MRKQSDTSAALPALDDLQAMAVFIRVVETASFTAAARALDITKSAVSKRVARLEDRLGVRLFDRTTRSVALTEPGRTFYASCVEIVGAIQKAELAVSSFGERPRGLLRVSGPVIFGELHLAPILPAFLAEFAEIRVDLSLSDRFVNLVEEGYDVAVRIGRLEDSSLVARRLARTGSVVCASPAYWAEHGEPGAPIELTTHNCLRYSLVTTQQEWRFRGADGEFSVPVAGTLQANHGGAMREAALAGLGVARLPRFIVADALRKGALRAVLEDFRTAESGVFAVYPAGRHPPPKVEAFVEFLAERLKERLR